MAHFCSQCGRGTVLVLVSMGARCEKRTKYMGAGLLGWKFFKWTKPCPNTLQSMCIIWYCPRIYLFKVEVDVSFDCLWGSSGRKMVKFAIFVILQKKGLYVLVDPVLKYYEASATGNPSKTVPKMDNTRTFIEFSDCFSLLQYSLIFFYLKKNRSHQPCVVEQKQREF